MDNRECKHHLRGHCNLNHTCKYIHNPKLIIKIIYEDINQHYMLGQSTNDLKEFYIPYYLIDKFYKESQSIRLNNHINKEYEVSYNPMLKKERYLVTSIIKRNINTSLSVKYINDRNTINYEKELNDIKDNYNDLKNLIKDYTKYMNETSISFSVFKAKTEKEIDRLKSIINKYENNINNLKSEINNLKKKEMDEEITPRRSKRLKVNKY